jgi:NADH-quinone oxidoreductase subunit A
MLGRYLPLLIALIVSAVIAGAMVVGSLLLGPKKPGSTKESTYECGMTPVGAARDRFPVRFYLVAMLFIVFDVETVFLYPWAATYGMGSRAERLFLLGEMGVFVAVLLVAYFYVLGTGALDWGRDTADVTAAGQQAASPGVMSRRRPIRLGNEASGPVRLPNEATRPAAVARPDTPA